MDTDGAWAYGPEKKERKKSRVLGAVFGFVLAASLVAVAAWLVTSINNDVATGGKAKSGAVTAPTWEPVLNGEISSTLMPGETGALTFKINNPNDGPLTLTKLEKNGTFNRTSTPNAACANNFQINDPGTGVIFSGSIAVPAGSSVVVVPGIVTLDPATPSTCQSQTVSIYGVTGTFST